MSREQLVDYFARHYGPKGATLIVVGDVTEGDILSKAEASFGDWAGGDGNEIGSAEDGEGASAPTTVFLADKPGAAQSVIRAGHLTVTRHHPDYYAIYLLNYVFGGPFVSRLNSNLREDKGYSYGYISSIDWLTGPSSLVAGGGVQTAVTREAVAETLKEFADIREGRPVTKAELEDARDGMLRGLPSQFETHGQTLQLLTRLVVFGLPDDYYSSFAASLQAVSLEDVHRVATERLDYEHLKILVVGDKDVVEPGLRELGLPFASVDYEGRELPAG